MSYRGAIVIMVMTLAMAASTGFAQDAKSAKARGAAATQTVMLGQGDSKFACYVARPAGDEPAPGLLLIHEWWGLNDWVKQQARRFAELGYVALAPDLYHGEVAKDADHAHELMRGLSDDRALADMKLAFSFLADHEHTRGKPVGVMGWCMGGGYALKLAIAEPRTACMVICYGKPVMDVEQLRRIKGPLLGIWGATDRGIEVEPFKKALAQAKVTSTHHVYPGAGHAFLNENNKRGYNKEQAEKACAEIDAFLERTLAATSVPAGARAAVRIHLATDVPHPGYSAMSAPKGESALYVAPDAVLTERDIVEAHVVEERANMYSVSIQFSPAAAEKLAQLTKEHMRDFVAILVDGKLVTAAKIMDEIKGGEVMITGDFGREEAEKIAGSIAPVRK